MNENEVAAEAALGISADPGAAPVDEAAVSAGGVRPLADTPADTPVGLPDHLLPGHPDLESAMAAYTERNPRFEDFGEMMAAHNERRADNSRRLEHWLNGGDQ